MFCLVYMRKHTSQEPQDFYILECNDRDFRVPSSACAVHYYCMAPQLRLHNESQGETEKALSSGKTEYS